MNRDVIVRCWGMIQLVAGPALLLLLLVAALGYRFGGFGLGPAFTMLAVVLFGSLAMAVVGGAGLLVYFLTTHRQPLWPLAVGLVMVLIPALVTGMQVVTARSVPAIHDITTDMVEPPTFDVAVELRGATANSLEYGAILDSAERHAVVQREAYPDVVPVYSVLDPPAAMARAAEVLRDMGLEVVNEDVAAGRIEAVATTFWFGFKDDVVVRVRGSGSGSRLDVRSVSRVGRSDIGANARRIRQFMTRFAA